VFESDPFVSPHHATRRQPGNRLDYGVNYVRNRGEAFVRVSRAALVVGLVACLPAPVLSACLTDPMMQGQDPTVVFKDGLYNLVQSDGCNLRLRRSPTLGGLATAANPVIYSPGCSEVWAPEIHWLGNRWYVYYTLNTNPGTGGLDRRGFVAESQGASPYGPYTNRGILFNDYWNIDGNVFTWSNQLYYVFSGEPIPGQQKIFVAPMSNPYTLSGPPVLLSTPTQPWETIGTPDVNEGPWGFERDGRLFIVYSASGCWTDDYTLGLLTLTGQDPLNAGSWTKSGPVFTQKPGAHGPGHNSLVQDSAGQWWNIYHANNNPGEGCGGLRQIRAQRIFWNTAGLPDFGSPVPVGSVINEDADFLVARFPLAETVGTTAISTVCGRTGTVMGAGTWANPGLIFNGVNTFVDCGSALGNDVQHALTLAAWVRPNAFGDWAGILAKGITVSPYAMQTWGDGSLRFTANWGLPPGSAGEGSWNSTAKLAQGTWQHVAVTYDGEWVRFFINGVPDANQPQYSMRFGVVNESLVIGADLPGGDEYFNGTIRDARVYGRALSQAEIQAMVNRPPVLTPVPPVSMVAGQTLVLTNTASDPDLPPQTLTFDLLAAPPGSSIAADSGVLTWPSTLADAGSTNPVTVRVTDNGTPNLSATQSFTVTARLPLQPVLGDVEIDGASLGFYVSGDPGVDYGVWNSSNLLDWSVSFITNPAVTPFRLSVPADPSIPREYFLLKVQ